MKITLAKSSGFCFGVKRALEIALQTAKARPRVYMLGDIVHNEDVVAGVKKIGVKKIARLARGKDKILLIRAHGASRKALRKGKQLGYKIVDATCPMVKEIHNIVREMEQKGYNIVVIGDRRHDEVQGIIGQLKGRAIVIEDPGHIPEAKIKKINKAAIVVQSTQDMAKVQKIYRILKPKIGHLRFFNTICRPTRSKQKEIKRLARRKQIMIIIGSRSSANTRRLYEIAKSLNRRSFWVQSKEQLKPGWFKGIKNAGIAAGASTPEETTEAVVKRIKKFI
jgi:4-hydroxy-3-methylbut-2-enyl diphosphate reductase